MSLPIATRPYRFYENIVRPLCSILLWLLTIVVSGVGIFVALEVAFTAYAEGTSSALPTLVSAIALFLGVSAIAVSLDEENPAVLAFLSFCTAVACWAVVGMHLWLRVPVIQYDEHEIRVTHDRKVVLPGQSVPRGFRNVQSEIVPLSSLSNKFKVDVALPGENITAVVTYSAAMLTKKNKNAIVQSILDTVPKTRIENIQSAITAETEILAQNRVRAFVRAEGIRAVGREILDRPEQLAWLKVETLELVKRGP